MGVERYSRGIATAAALARNAASALKTRKRRAHGALVLTYVALSRHFIACCFPELRAILVAVEQTQASEKLSRHSTPRRLLSCLFSFFFFLQCSDWRFLLSSGFFNVKSAFVVRVLLNDRTAGACCAACATSRVYPESGVPWSAVAFL